MTETHQSILAWDTSASEAAHLLNPAFIGEIITHTVGNYQKFDPEGMAFPLVFLAPAIILPGNLRKNLPRTSATKMLAWLAANPESRVRFGERVQHMAPYTRRGIIYACHHGALIFNHQGNLLLNQKLLSQSNRTQTDDIKDCVKRAALVGEWFASSGSLINIFNAWGIRP